MANAIKTKPLATSVNDVVTPLYFDRQIVRADDLMLDRVSHDAELERMRRLLHGWGIVAGFTFLKTDLESGRFSLGKGYGITPNGNEIYLTEALEISDLAERLKGCCGSGDATCDVVDIAERTAIDAKAREGIIEGWIVARPYFTDSELRPGVPVGCAHPANALLPSRRCEGARFDIVCALRYPHIPDEASCEVLTEWMCKVPKEGRQPLPMPDIVAAEDDYLVIAKIALDDGVLSLTYENRRMRLPVAILQDWMTACMCAAKPAPITTPAATTSPAPTTTKPPSTTPGPFTTPPIFTTLTPFTTPPIFTTSIPFTTPPVFTTFAPFTTPPIFTTFGPDIDGPLVNPVDWQVLNNRAAANGLSDVEITSVDNQAKLTAVGIDNPAKLMVVDLDEVSAATGIAKPKLEIMKSDIKNNRFLVGGLQL